MMTSTEADATRCASGVLTSLGVWNGFGADKGLSSSTGDWDTVHSSPWTLVSLVHFILQPEERDEGRSFWWRCHAFFALPLGLPQVANLNEESEENRLTLW